VRRPVDDSPDSFFAPRPCPTGHARRRVKEDRRRASRARAAAEAAPVLAAAVALATAEAVPRQLMVGESGSAYRLPSQGEEPDWSGQPEGARASAREPLGTLWW
jgi:hypothetical protein